MATLQHVSIWNNEHGWQHITPEEAAKEFAYSVSSDWQRFMCESCGQYATFVNGANTPHFKHPRGSKDCDEKITSYRNYHLTNPQGFSLPLKIKINDNKIELLIGFLPIPNNIFSKLEEENVKLSIIANEKVLRQFSINESRFSLEHTTYLSVGDNIAKEYRISYPDMNSQLKVFWPIIVNGINPEGTVFDYESGKRLPQNASVIVGKTYLIIIDKRKYIHSGEDISITKECSFKDYDVIKVVANKLSRSADDFFRYFSCRLTDNPATLTLLYPFSVNSSHVIRHTENKVWFYKTNGFIDVYPYVYLYNQVSNEGIFPISGGLQQLISVSRFEQHTSVLRYTLLKKVDFIDEKPTLPLLQVFDNLNEPITVGTHDSLPKDREMHIVSEYDGFVLIIKNNSTIDKIILKSDVKVIIDVDYDLTYQIYQGLDCHYELHYKKRSCSSISDEALLLELQNFKHDFVSITHSIHILANYLSLYPKSKQWLRKQIKNGKINKKAIKRILEVK